MGDSMSDEERERFAKRIAEIAEKIAPLLDDDELFGELVEIAAEIMGVHDAAE